MKKKPQFVFENINDLIENLSLKNDSHKIDIRMSLNKSKLSI